MYACQKENSGKQGEHFFAVAFFFFLATKLSKLQMNFRINMVGIVEDQT